MNSALANLTWPEVEPRAAVLAVPVGSTEQHGPHLPLSTDTDIALALAAGFGDACDQAVVAPPIAYGSSGEHADFPGTLSIGRTALEMMLLELGRSAAEWFARIVFISAHGGNAEPVTNATRQLREEGHHVLAWSPGWRGDAHAGRIETSIMLALRPELVSIERMAAGNLEPLTELWAKLRAGGTRAVSPNGVLGDPRGASAEEGRRLLAEATTDLVATAAVCQLRAPPGRR